MGLLMTLEPTAQFRAVIQFLAVLGGLLLVFVATRRRITMRYRIIIGLVGGLTAIADALFILLT